MAAVVDVNVLIALLYGRHEHSARAIAWLGTVDAPGSIAVCRVAQMGALRIMTNRAILRDDVRTPRQFWSGWDRMMADDRFVITGEAAPFEKTWREVTGALTAVRSAGTDDYLAAFAIAGDHTLVTFDRDFRGYRDLKLDLLSG